MSENNLECRIWDNQEMKWLPDVEQGNGVSVVTVITQKGFVNQFRIYTSGLFEDLLFPRERCEISQYIGRKDSKGVKAFTGDEVTFTPGDKAFIIFHEPTSAYVFYRSGEFVSIDYEPFTIIGNKWEGLHAAESKAPIEQVCDSTVQQQPPSSIHHRETDKNYIKWEKELNEELASNVERNSMAFEEAREEYLSKSPVGIKPKWLHDEHRAIELLKAILRYSQAEKDIPNDWFDELEMLTPGRTSNPNS